MTSPQIKRGLKCISFRQLLFVILPVVVFFGIAETAARIHEHWAPPLPVDIGQGFDGGSQLFVPAKNGYVETNPAKRVSFKEQRFLYEKPDRTLRIFALGGSSVNYLDYEFSQLRQALQTALADRYNEVEVINCGGLSYGTHRLVSVAAEILEYAPDVLLIYSGHNEFEEVQQMHLAGLRYAPTQRVLSSSALFRFLRDQWAQRRITALRDAQKNRAMAASVPDSSKAWLHVFTPEEIQERMNAFKKNLETILSLANENGIPVIVGTVPSNLFRPNLPGKDGAAYEEVIALFNQGRHEEGLRLGREILRKASPRHQSSDAENEIIRQVAREQGAFLADVEAAILAMEPNGIPGQTLFNDHCHLNPEGNSILRNLYQEKILECLSQGDASAVHDKLQ